MFACCAVLCCGRAARYMDVAAHAGQVVTDLELLKKLMAAWAAEDRDDTATVATDDESNLQDSPTAVPGPPAPETSAKTPEQQLKAEQQLQQPRQQPGPRQRQQQLEVALPQALPQHRWQRRMSLPALPPGSTAGRDSAAGPPWDRSRQPLQAADQDPHSLLELAQRSRSETSAVRQHVTFNLPPRLEAHRSQQLAQPQRHLHQLRGSTCSSSFTYGTSVAVTAADLRSPLSPLVPQLSLTGVGNPNRAGLTGLPEGGLTITSQEGVVPALCEPVHARHVGTFNFKGSGEFAMAEVLHASILRRTFPAEPPKGKGQRLVNTTGPVKGLQAVQLQIPQCVLAARRVYRSGM